MKAVILAIFILIGLAGAKIYLPSGDNRIDGPGYLRPGNQPSHSLGELVMKDILNLLDEGMKQFILHSSVQAQEKQDHDHDHHSHDHHHSHHSDGAHVTPILQPSASDAVAVQAPIKDDKNGKNKFVRPARIPVRRLALDSVCKVFCAAMVQNLCHTYTDRYFS